MRPQPPRPERSLGFGKRLFWYANTALLGIFTFVVVYAGLAPSQNKFKLFESPLPIVVGACALVAGLFWLTEAPTIRFIKQHYKAVMIAAFTLSVLVQLIVAHALRSYGYTWDSNLILTQATNFADKGSIDPSFVPYLAANPNNIALLAILGGFFKGLKQLGIHDYLSAAVLLNVTLMSASSILTFLTAKLLYGRRIASITLIFTFVFISLSMYVQIPYTDTLTIVFPILVLYLAVHIARAKQLWLRVVLSACIGLTSLLGYLIKPTVLIALIAVAITGLVAFVAHYKRKINYWLTSSYCAAACLVTLLAANLTYGVIINHINIVPFPLANTQETSKPLAHFFAMGLKTTRYSNTVEYGGYDNGDSDAVDAKSTQAAKVAYSDSVATQRLGQYGVLGYLGFLSHKANWIMSDGTFYAYGEGSNQNVVFTSHDPISTWLRSFMYIDGAWFVLFGNILQVFWMALLILIGAQVVVVISNRRDKLNIYDLAPRLMIAGIIVFLLLFEGRSRYLFLYIPIFIIAAMGSLQWFKNSGDQPSSKAGGTA